MKFAIITHVDHILENGKYFGYAPYVKEMNIWGKYVSKFLIVAPTSNRVVSKIETGYSNRIDLHKIPAISFTSFSEALKGFIFLPYIFFKVVVVMKKSDHIHLRCPGNIGLIGCLAQIFFPRKPKTAKYAGNWDPYAKQPLSYRFQKWLLGNTFLTKNMQVLVYGEWEGQSKNIKAFFTASYTESKIKGSLLRTFKANFNALFVGTLSPGKRPLYAVQLIEGLNKSGISITMDVYGEGTERNNLESYIKENELTEIVRLKGNQTASVVEAAYKESDLLLLPSKSEGWPKAVAEAMFWGVVPIVTNVSCISWMVGHGDRGVLISTNFEEDLAVINQTLKDKSELTNMSLKAQDWSQRYTLDVFESEIEKLIVQ